MESLLIVNADDFGLSKGQNYGIIEAHKHGVVTSTTALINGDAIEHAVELSRSVPELAVGMHFSLTLGTPLSSMPKLTREGKLGKWIWQMVQDNQLPLDEIVHELSCQYERFITLFGAKPSHIDSHHHVHMIPQIFERVANFAVSKDVALRIDHDAPDMPSIPDGVRTTEAFSSAFYGESVLSELFEQVLENANLYHQRSLEIMCHPAFIDHTIMGSAYCYPRLTELEVLTSASLKQTIKQQGYRLGTYHDI